MAIVESTASMPLSRRVQIFGHFPQRLESWEPNISHRAVDAVRPSKWNEVCLHEQVKPKSF
jgi:hypothetical protein